MFTIKKQIKLWMRINLFSAMLFYFLIMTALILRESILFVIALAELFLFYMPTYLLWRFFEGEIFLD